MPRIRSTIFIMSSHRTNDPVPSWKIRGKDFYVSSPDTEEAKPDREKLLKMLQEREAAEAKRANASFRAGIAAQAGTAALTVVAILLGTLALVMGVKASTKGD